ncbi:MAG TPA: cell envelope integrity protein CreD [Candidatus Eisenbacteria bacterium]
MQNPVQGSWFHPSQAWRLLLVIFLVLVLLVPILMIGGVIAERRMRRQEAIEDVSAKWGRRQVITGPALVIPYTHRWTETGDHGKTITHTELRYATFLPERLAIRGRVAGESRSRGIYTVPVYRASLALEGAFARPSFREWNIGEPDVDWGKARLVVGISDVRAVQEQPALRWNGRRVGFLPGTGPDPYLDSLSGIHAVVGVGAKEESLEFSFPVELNGSVGAYFTPFGGQTSVELSSNWESPSFQGNWLPSRRDVSSHGFTATWSIPFLGRNYPQAWLAGSVEPRVIEASRFGVDLIAPVDEHRMAERSVKFAGLFILLTFASIWLTEVLARLRVHPIQYLLLGAALCLFYLLELSLAEHLGFSPAYALASLAIVGMVAAYSISVLRTVWRAGTLAAVVVALYGYLYVLLTNEDYALLVGSIGLFLILAVIMFLTRRVDWYASPLPEGSSEPR